jgi:hypothetical protein
MTMPETRRGPPGFIIYHLQKKKNQQAQNLKGQEGPCVRPIDLSPQGSDDDNDFQDEPVVGQASHKKQAGVIRKSTGH